MHLRRLITSGLLMISCTLVMSGCAVRAPIASEPSKPKPQWSIGLLSGPSLLELNEFAAGRNPRFTAADVTTPISDFVADPFLIKEGSKYFLFFELFNRGNGRGELGVAESSDLIDWDYKGVVLTEPFHLSYPFVFKEGDSYYMIPESRAAGEVRLYKSVSFPMQWKFEKTLLRGQFVDSSLVRFRNTWWLFSGVSPYSLSIFYADSFRGPWKPHALNPVYRADSSRARPAGRPVVQNGELIRFVQDNREGYGKKVRAMRVEAITPNEFRERVVEPDPFLAAAGTGWRSNGMHHVSALEQPDRSWIAAIDGSGDSQP
jgi:hypothetical protein